MTDRDEILRRTEAHVREQMHGEGTGHDWWHVDRVRRMALRLARDEGADPYVTELAAGSKVLCVNTRGECRELAVGRVKMEVRPLLLIQGRAADQTINVIVQDDWHIRIMGADGKPKNATAIRPGDELLAFVDRPGRHVGLKVDETIIEQ